MRSASKYSIGACQIAPFEISTAYSSCMTGVFMKLLGHPEASSAWWEIWWAQHSRINLLIKCLRLVFPKMTICGWDERFSLAHEIMRDIIMMARLRSLVGPSLLYVDCKLPRNETPKLSRKTAIVELCSLMYISIIRNKLVPIL